MSVAIEVQSWGERDGFYVDLARLLAACPTDAHRLEWAVWSLRGVGTERAADLVRRFRDRPGGRALLSWGQLLRLAREMGEVQWGVFAGFARVDEIVGPDAEDFFQHPVLALEAFDGWSWRVVARTPDWLEGFRARFKALAPVEDAHPRPWWRR
jgi:hypothetical protein